MKPRSQGLVRTYGLATVALSLLQCTPDLDSLSHGVSSGAGGSAGTAESSNGGVEALGAASGSAGEARAGASSAAGRSGAANGTAGETAGTAAGGAAGTAAGGTAGTAAGGTAGAPSGGTAGAAAGAGGAHVIAGASPGGATNTAGTTGEAGEAGSRMTDPCAFSHPNALAYDGFDHDLTGQGFDPVLPDTSPTSNGTAVTAAWSATGGHTCPGSFLVTPAFKSYSANSDVATAVIQFPSTDWTGAVALHAWVKVNPTSAPLAGVQLFVMSGPNLGAFAGYYETSRFSFGTWYEMVVPLTPGNQFVPTSVSRVGLQVSLKQAGSSGVPATPPTTYVWMDDIWVEKAH